MSSSFFQELRRRKVVRVGTAYAITAFVVLQVADLVVEPLALPPWTMTLVVVLLVLGFPPALGLAWAFEWTPEGVRRTVAADAAALSADVAASRGRWPVAHRLLVGGAALVLALAGGAFLVLRDRTAPAAAPLDPNAVAVLPFRIAADPSLDYLGDGMVDLLAAKLTGEGGPRAVDSRSVLRLWEVATAAGARPLDRADALDLARAVGAGHLLLGEIVGTAAQLTLSASLHDVAAGASGQPVTVLGPVDSLPSLVDRLAAQLLSLRAGEGERRLAVLTSASLPALRAYLAGKAAYRGGRFSDAAAAFRRAVEIDSTFALAGLELVLAGEWAEGGPQIQLGYETAWRGRDRLPVRERRRLEIRRVTSFPEALALSEALIREEPADAEAWLSLGELLLHRGPLVGHPDALERALHAFERAVAIDSIYAPALFHTIEIHARRGDTAQVRRLAEIYFQRNAPEGGYHSYIGWRTALALEQREMLESLRADRFEAMPYPDLWTVALLGQTDALPLTDVELAFDASERRAATTADRLDAELFRIVYLLNGGRPSEAERVRVAVRWTDVARADAMLVLTVRAGLYWEGDTAAAALAAAQLERSIAEAPPEDAAAARRRIDALCALEERRLARGDASRAAETVAAVRLTALESPSEPEYVLDLTGAIVDRCVAYVSVLQAAIETGDPRAPAVTAQLAVLDSVLSTALAAGRTAATAAVGNLVAARLHAARGDPQAALQAIRRRPYWGMPLLLSTALLEEAVLAEQAGDPDGAVLAYAHYLHLHAAAEPGLEAEVQRARRELERLQSR